MDIDGHGSFKRLVSRSFGLRSQVFSGHDPKLAWTYGATAVLLREFQPGWPGEVRESKLIRYQAAFGCGSLGCHPFQPLFGLKQWPLKPCQVHFQGGDCSAAADFSHAAGVVNVAICPSQPAAAVLVPPVQDVYGDPGDAKFRLYGLPVGPSAAVWDAAGQAWLCQDTPSRSPGAGFESRF